MLCINKKLRGVNTIHGIKLIGEDSEITLVRRSNTMIEKYIMCDTVIETERGASNQGSGMEQGLESLQSQTGGWTLGNEGGHCFRCI